MNESIYRKAYDAGFRKTAERFGIEPSYMRSLIDNITNSSGRIEKNAALAQLGRIIGSSAAGFGRGLGYLFRGSKSLLRSAGTSFSKKFNRYLELLAGGNENAVKDYKKVRKWVKDQQRFAEKANNLEEVKKFKDLDQEIADAFLRGNGKSYTAVMPEGDLTITAGKDLSDEIGKSIAVRTLTGTGLAGGGLYGYKKYKDYNEKWYNKLFD